jgi:serine/threonine-protein kinase
MASQQSEPAPLRPLLSVGRYALYGEIAVGGMATVHFGRMSSLGGFSRTVAIKRMRRDIAMDPEFVAMFLDEARLTSRVVHPNVVATLDVVAEGGEVFLVMEYVRGESLARLVRAARTRRSHVPVAVAVSIGCGALAGLHASHEVLGEGGVPLGIVHRDISPQNILVGEDGIARVTDFGIAKSESRLQVTRDGQMKGKLPYMAPEQLGQGAGEIDRRADVFSCAVVLWELLTGRKLFMADHPGRTIANVLTAPVPSICSVRNDVSTALDGAIRAALARDPGERPQTAETFAVQLEKSLARGIASPRAVGAWVSGLAGEVLANRFRYVRDMESSTSMSRETGERVAFGGVVVSPRPAPPPAPASDPPSPSQWPLPSEPAPEASVPPPPAALPFEVRAATPAPASSPQVEPAGVLWKPPSASVAPTAEAEDGAGLFGMSQSASAAAREPAEAFAGTQQGAQLAVAAMPALGPAEVSGAPEGDAGADAAGPVVDRGVVPRSWLLAAAVASVLLLAAAALLFIAGSRSTNAARTAPRATVSAPTSAAPTQARAASATPAPAPPASAAEPVPLAASAAPPDASPEPAAPAASASPTPVTAHSAPATPEPSSASRPRPSGPPEAAAAATKPRPHATGAPPPATAKPAPTQEYLPERP